MRCARCGASFVREWPDVRRVTCRGPCAVEHRRLVNRAKRRAWRASGANRLREKVATQVRLASRDVGA